VGDLRYIVESAGFEIFLLELRDVYRVVLSEEAVNSV